MASDVGSFVRCKESYGAGYVGGRPHAAEWNLLGGILLELVAEHVGHGSFDEAWSDCVASNVARSQFAGDGHGQADEPGFRRGVVGLSRLPHLAEDAGDVDDASPALLEHGGGDLLDAEICGGKVSLQDGVPVSALHAHDELVAGDAGVIDQDVDLAELADGGLDGGLDLPFVGDVEGKGRGLAACGGDLVHQIIQLVLITRGYGYCCAGAREFQCAGSSDALRCSGDERYASGKRHLGFSRLLLVSSRNSLGWNVKLYAPLLRFGASQRPD